MTERLAADGTAAFLPTLVTGDPETLLGTIRAVVAARKRYPACEKAIRGFFLEGPFISSEPGAVGTHPVEWVRPSELAAHGFDVAVCGAASCWGDDPFLPRYARHAPNLVSARAAGAALLGSIDTSWTIRLVPKRLQLPLFAADPAAALAREMTPATAARAADIVWGVFGLEGGGA